jgi:tetratricopeptide (TPR) repeat protein
VFDQQGRHRESLEHNNRAYELFRQAGDLFGQASSLNGIGWCHALLGDYHQTLSWCGRALALFQEIGNRALEGAT